MANLVQDLRYAIRVLSKNPAFSILAVLSLAIGIGANTAVFSLIDPALLELLPVKNPRELAIILTSREGELNYNFAYREYEDFQKQAEVFDGLIAYAAIPIVLSEGQPERIWGQIVTANYFSMLGLQPESGRTFVTDEDKAPGAAPFAVISHGFWSRRFGSNPGAIGSTIHLNNSPFTVIGVAPKRFTSANRGFAPDVWVLVSMNAQLIPGSSEETLNDRNERWLEVMGRLKPGASREQAQSVMTSVGENLQRLYPRPTPESFIVTSGEKGNLGTLVDITSPLIYLAGIVFFLLLIACANIANLLLARATARRREIAMRLALGATRGRLIRLLLTESLLLALIGGVVSLLVARWGAQFLAAYKPASSGAPIDIVPAINLKVLVVTLALSALTGLLIGLSPAFRTSSVDIATQLKGSANAVSAGSQGISSRNLLVVAQVALALVLLVGATLFIRSFQNAQRIDKGFDSEHVLMATIDLDLQGYGKQQANDFYKQLVEQVSHQPGVQTASMAFIVPPNRSGMRMDVFINGPIPTPQDGATLNYAVVTPSYFETMKIGFMQGRDFSAQDLEQYTRVAIINEAMAEFYWPNMSPLGEQIGMGPGGPYLEVIGVVKNSKYRNLKEPSTPYLYLPVSQRFRPAMTLLARSSGELSALARVVRQNVSTLDSSLPLFNVKPLAEHVNVSLAQDRAIAWLVGVFSLLALLLATVGIYGTTSYSVKQRTRELGIRMAMGAGRSDILRMILQWAAALALTGVAIGLVLSFLVNRLIQTELFAVSATDPITLLETSGVLFAIVLLASLSPAYRATRIDPVRALRYE